MQTLKQSTFIEQMVKRGTKEKDTVKRIVIVITGLLLMILPFLISPSLVYYIEPLVVLVVAFAIWILWRRASREYEYIYTDGNIDIDVIYGRTSRKHLVSFDTRSAKIIAPAENPKALNATHEKPQQTIMACRGAIEDDTYVVVGEFQSRTYHIYFEPDYRILQGIKTYSPRNSIIRPEDLVPKEEPTVEEEESDL